MRACRRRRSGRCASSANEAAVRRDDRLTAILDLLGEEGSIEVDRVVEAFGASPATARRDLDVLERLSLDVAMLGVNGLDPDAGPTVHDDREVRVA